MRPSLRRSRITTSRRARTIACRPIRWRSRSRWPTRSTRWPGSSPSTRSRPDRRTRYALRRAALGVIRIVLERRQSLLRDLTCAAVCPNSKATRRYAAKAMGPKAKRGQSWRFGTERLTARLLRRPPEGSAARSGRTRHDLVDAVFALGGQDDLSCWSCAGSRRSANSSTATTARTCSPASSARPISFAIEEKKDKRKFDGAPDASLFKVDEEKALAAAIAQVKLEAGAAVAKEDFASAMSAMAKLRPAVDAFFDKVKVNARRQGGAREPPEASERNPRSHASCRRFLEDSGLRRCRFTNSGVGPAQAGTQTFCRSDIRRACPTNRPN